MINDELSSADPLGQIADEFVEAFRQGKRPSVEEFARRYPAHADDIRDMLPALVLMERAKSTDGAAGQGQLADGPAAETPLRQLGDYQILREVGSGGMGVVYEAQQLSLARRVALKVLPKGLVLDAKLKQRFEREARAAAKLHHTNIVPVFGVGEHEGMPYYVMQFIQGLGLDEVLTELRRLRAGTPVPAAVATQPDPVARRDLSAVVMARSLLTGQYQHPGPMASADEAPAGEGIGKAATVSTQAPDLPVPARDAAPTRLSPSVSSSSLILAGKSDSSGRHAPRRQTYWQRVAALGVQVGEALGYAHKQGVLHRDIKPSNLLLDTRGVVWVTDFGLAKVEDQRNLTHTGDIMGTLRYMPPEAFQGRTDARADLYALGMTLYEFLTFRPGFDSPDRLKLIAQISSDEPARPRSIDSQIPRDLETIVLRAIEKDPKRRYPTAEELAEDLQRFINDEPIKARRLGVPERCWRWCRHNPALAGLMAALVVVFLAGFAGVTWKWREADWQKGMAEQQQARALAGEQEAKEQRTRADNEAEVTRQNLYYAQMHLAQQAWREHRGLSHMHELLANWLPEGASPDRRGWEWFYLNSLPYENLRTLTEPWGYSPTSVVAWHAASNRLAEGTSAGLIRIWDVDRERTTLILRGPAPVQSWEGARWLGWSPDGGKLAGGCNDATVHVWETITGRELYVLTGHQSPIRSVAFNSNGGRVAAWGEDGTIKIWDANTGRLTAEVVHPKEVRAGAWSPDDNLLASGHEDGTVTISGTHGGDKVVTLRKRSWGVYDLAWSPDGTRLASAGADFTARIWDVASEKMVVGPLRHSHRVMSVAWEPNGQRLATCSVDETVKVWNATTGREEVTLRGHRERIDSLAWGPNGRLASASADGSIRISDRIRDQQRCVLSGHVGSATSVSWSPSGKRLASGGDDGKILIWDPTTREAVLTITPHFGPIRALAWSPDSQQLASAWSEGNVNLKVWGVPSGREVFALPGGAGGVFAVAWSQDGTRLAAGSRDGTIHVVESLKENPKVHVFHAHRGPVRTLAWNPQGDRLASGGEGDTGEFIKLWDPIRGTELARLQDSQSGGIGVAWSPDGKRLAAFAGFRLVITWDAETGRKLATMRGHNDDVVAVAWSPDGTRLASAAVDNSVRVWDPRIGEETLVLQGNAGFFLDVSWHPDGVMLAAACSDGLIWIWDATRGFERDATPRGLPYIDRKVASGNARGEDLLWYAQSYFRAGKPREGLALVKDNPTALLQLYAKLTPDDQKVLAQLRPGVEADWLRVLPQQPDLEQAAFAWARSRVQSGIAAFEGGRLAEAIRDLQAARDLLRILDKVNPNDGRLSSNLGMSLGFLGSALRDSHRPVEALASIQDASLVLKSMRHPGPIDLYNLACGYAQLSVLLQHAATPPTAAEREALADQAMDALRRSIAAGMKNFARMERDHDLDPLRQRPDFRALMMESAGTTTH
jgi:WD40 repeat protein/serine/threonine protein kinase